MYSSELDWMRSREGGGSKCHIRRFPLKTSTRSAPGSNRASMVEAIGGLIAIVLCSYSPPEHRQHQQEGGENIRRTDKDNKPLSTARKAKVETGHTRDSIEYRNALLSSLRPN